MEKEEIKEILKILETNYTNFINDKNRKEMFDAWSVELSQYSFEDVKERLKEILKDEKYQLKPPTLYYIIKGLPKTNDRINWSEMVYFCDNCHKAFNDYDEMLDHRARENSIEYVITQTKKWFDKDLNKAELWAMEEKEFQLRYLKLLQHIYEHTTNQEEKTRVGYIFCPPNQEEAQTFINKTNN